MADQTGESVQAINHLIDLSSNQVENGLSRMASSSQVLRKVIEDVDIIHNLTRDLEQSTETQVQEYNRFSDDLMNLNERSQHIRQSASEQKNAMSEILDNVSNLNISTQTYADTASLLTNIARDNDRVTRDFTNRITQITSATVT